MMTSAFYDGLVLAFLRDQAERVAEWDLARPVFICKMTFVTFYFTNVISSR